MNQKAKDYIRRNTLDLESDNRMDSTGYVQYAISEAKAYAAIATTQMINEKKKDYLIPPSALVAVSFPGSISNILFQYSFDWL